MINITVRSGTYSFEQIDKKLSKTFDDKTDRELFLQAMLTTGQAYKEKGKFVFPFNVKKEYITPKYIDLDTYKYAGKRRTGIRVGKEWVDRFGYPSELYISKVEIDGELVNVKEKPRLNIVKGRYPETIEAWRAEIPAEIREKYNITPNTQIHLAVTSTVTDYFTDLQLYGYKYRVMLMYGETSQGVNPRNLELDGNGFVSETKQDISGDIKQDQQKIQKLLEKLLMKAEPEYYGLYMESLKAGNIVDNVEAIPLKEKTSISPVVELRDLANKRIIIDWDTNETSTIPSSTRFRANLNIDTGLASIRGQTKLERKWSNKGGFK